MASASIQTHGSMMLRIQSSKETGSLFWSSHAKEADSQTNWQVLPGCVVHHENTQRWMVCTYKVISLPFLSFGEILSAVSLHIESTDSTIP